MKIILFWQTDVLYCKCKEIQAVCVCLCMCSCFCTSIVDISRDLYVTLLCVDWQFIKVFVFLQREFSSKRHWIPILIHCVDQYGVKVVKLYGRVKDNELS